MGDPKRLRKKYSTPVHPWNAANIELEKELIKEYKLGNKKEIWKISSVLKKYKDLAKKLIAVKTAQGEKERNQMMDKLFRWGLIGEGAALDDVLSLNVKDLMERRLQSLVFRMGLSRSMKQARQFIVHRHVRVGNKKITFPSYIVSRDEEGQIQFDGQSTLSDAEHPERAILDKKEKMEEKKPEEDKKPKEKPSGEAQKEAVKEKKPEEMSKTPTETNKGSEKQ
jgi:small subunit ribosomal protein S4